jgi:hypothetical protein
MLGMVWAGLFPAARRWLICALCAARVRWPARSLVRRARSLPA